MRYINNRSKFLKENSDVSKVNEPVGDIINRMKINLAEHLDAGQGAGSWLNTMISNGYFDDEIGNRICRELKFDREKDGLDFRY